MEIIAGILLFATFLSSITYPAMFMVCGLVSIALSGYLSLKFICAGIILGVPAPEMNLFANERRVSIVKALIWLSCGLLTTGLLLNRWPLF